MASNSSFLSRFSLSRGDAPPVLPLHINSRHPLRHKPSEYDLAELSPRAEQSLLLSSDPEPAFLQEAAKPTSPPSSSFFAQDVPSSFRAAPGRNDYEQSLPPSPPSTRPKQRVLFAGPPPPIATSMLVYRDVEDRGGAVSQDQPRARHGYDQLGVPSIRLPASTVLLDQRSPSTGRRSSKIANLDGDSTWTILQRREGAIQKEIQNYLDIQSAGLSAGLGRGPLNPSPSPGPSSDGGLGTSDNESRRRSRSNTPTAESAYTSGGRPLRLPTDRATASGAVIPVRQPRPRKIGLRAARSGLARSIALLADLKAEEDSSLAAALHARKRALAQLRKLAGRRSDLAGELQTLETDDEEPLARELKTLQTAHASTIQQITELEGQLAMLRARKRTLEVRIDDATSQREAGLSGYRGALKEVEAQLSSVLRRPPIQPLDVNALGGGGGAGGGSERGTDDGEADAVSSSPGGVEFLRMRPERRTADMARSWWENEVQILERRKSDVDTERAALEEGGAIWLKAVQLVSDFEADLRKEMAADAADSEDGGSLTKGKERAPTPEEKMRAQLAKMASVITGLQEHLQTAENKGWNLLICAIGAELEAFQEARAMLQGALREAGLEVDDADDSANNFVGGDGFGGPGGIEDEDTSATPRLARSASDALTFKTAASNASIAPPEPLVDVDARDGNADDHGTSESDDNDVPPELFATHDEETSEHNNDMGHEGPYNHGEHGPEHEKDDSSENEVPLEFLSEQQTDGEP